MGSTSCITFRRRRSKKCRGCTLKDIVSDFDRNRLEENDKAVNDYVEKTFGTDQNVYDIIIDISGILLDNYKDRTTAYEIVVDKYTN